VRDPLLIELRIYEIGMEYGKRGQGLEAFVSEQYRKRNLLRVPKAPPPLPGRGKQLRSRVLPCGQSVQPGK
jgi:hypothetical protein